MITHVVLMKLRKPHAGVEEEVRDRLLALPPKIPEIRHYEVGLNVSDSERACDLALVSRFDSRRALEAYRVHPDHQELLNWLRDVLEHSVVVDYES